MIQGERGPKGDKGDKGERGLQGERGFRGERGISGEGIKIIGVLPNERELPLTNNVVGDAYLIEDKDEIDGAKISYLYVWSDNALRKGWINTGAFRGRAGRDLMFHWDNTQLGVKLVGEDDYKYSE